jgi:aryl-alcohol dehydrogenase-like predicted oxidoreductase
LIATIHRALDCGVTMLDTAEVYGPFTNEELVGRAIRGRREGLTIATKIGFDIKGEGTRPGLNGRPEHVKEAVRGSLARLGIDTIDLLYLHRKDPAVAIEDTVGAMADLVAAGTVRYLGLSEVGGETLRRACAVHPIAALQSEYSVWERGIEEAVLPAARALGVGLVPFSPLGRGFLAGAFTGATGLPAGDFRHQIPRLDSEHAPKNAAIVDVVRTIAARHDATPAQVALAWVLAQGDDVVPIPGTTRRKHLDQNLEAARLRLTEQDLASLDRLASMVAGDRYTPQLAQTVER